MRSLPALLGTFIVTAVIVAIIFRVQMVRNIVVGA